MGRSDDEVLPAGSETDGSTSADTPPGPKPSGIGLPLKVAAGTSVTVALLLGILAILLHGTAREALERETDVHGTSVVRLLASVDPDSWSSTRDSVISTAEKMVEDAKQYGVYLEKRYGITVGEVDDSREARRQLGDEFLAQQEVLVEEFRQLKQEGAVRLAGLVHHALDGEEQPSAVIDAYVLDEALGSTVIRAGNSVPFVTDGAVRRFALSDEQGGAATETRIQDGSLGSAGAVRLFTHPIHAEDGSVTHRAHVFVDTSRLSALSSALGGRLIFFVTVLSLLGGAAAWGMTRWRMTAPLLSLAQDARSLAEGDRHARPSIHRTDEIGLLARSLDSAARRLDHALADHDQAIASDVHRKLGTEAVPYLPHFDLDVFHGTGGTIEAAAYDFLDLPDGRLGFLVAEASGGGIAAAMNVLMAQTLLRAELQAQHGLKEALKNVDTSLHHAIHAEMSISMAAGVLDPKDGKLSVAVVGELPALLSRAGSSDLEDLPTSTVAMGVNGGSEFAGALRVVDMELQPGDRLVFANAAVLGLPDRKGHPLGHERFRHAANEASRNHDGHFARGLRSILKRQRSTSAFDRDVVVLTLGRKAAGSAS